MGPAGEVRNGRKLGGRWCGGGPTSWREEPLLDVCAAVPPPPLEALEEMGIISWPPLLQPPSAVRIGDELREGVAVGGEDVRGRVGVGGGGSLASFFTTAVAVAAEAVLALLSSSSSTIPLTRSSSATRRRAGSSSCDTLTSPLYMYSRIARTCSALTS